MVAHINQEELDEIARRLDQLASGDSGPSEPSEDTRARLALEHNSGVFWWDAEA